MYKHIHRLDFPVYLLTPEQYWFDLERPIAELTTTYNDDYTLDRPQPCQIHPWPLAMSNIKLYNRYFDAEGAVKEVLKYTTTNECCVFDDLARPINSGRGYPVN